MNFKRNLRKTSFYIVLGIILIIIGILIYRSNKDKKVQIVVSPTPVVSLAPSTSFAKVIRVIDGDTIIINTGQKIRYIGINTPEIENDECYATEASEINKGLVLGKNVRLEKDVSEVDKYGRLLRYVYIDDRMINDELVKEGASKIMTVPPDTKYKDKFLFSQSYAKESKLGLWRKCL